MREHSGLIIVINSDHTLILSWFIVIYAVGWVTVSTSRLQKALLLTQLEPQNSRIFPRPGFVFPGDFRRPVRTLVFSASMLLVGKHV